jgi:hypothetical protein
MKKLYSFSTQANIKEWRIVNDGVMGGIIIKTQRPDNKKTNLYLLT